MRKSYRARRSGRRSVVARLPVEFLPLLDAVYSESHQWKSADSVFEHNRLTRQSVIVELIASALADALFMLYDNYEHGLPDWDTDRLLKWLSGRGDMNLQDSVTMLSSYTEDLSNWHLCPDGRWRP